MARGNKQQSEAANAPTRLTGAGLGVFISIPGSSTSPYLREAAMQPVAWYPWGEEPFRLAKELDRPIRCRTDGLRLRGHHVFARHQRARGSGDPGYNFPTARTARTASGQVGGH
jgi:hypothetical protein